MDCDCAGDDDGNAADDPGEVQIEQDTDATGHVHELILDVMDINADAVFTAPTETTNGHTHNVMFTEANLQTLQDGMELSVTTAADGTGHTHTFTILCPVLVPDAE